MADRRPLVNISGAIGEMPLADNLPSQLTRLYIQPANPNMTTPGMWWQTDASGNLVTLWVETG